MVVLTMVNNASSMIDGMESMAGARLSHRGCSSGNTLIIEEGLVIEVALL